MAVSIRLEDFAGQIPRRSARLLPDTFAEEARNTQLFRGTLRGINKPTLQQLLDAEGDVGCVVRVPNTPDDIWLTFESDDVDFEPGPAVNDTFERFYWTGDGAPKYNTRARMAAGDAPLLLGVPAPATAPTVGATGGVGGPETRSYVYTYVSALGEEGPPSPPTTHLGKVDDTWTVSNMDDSGDVPDGAERLIATKRIYRTITGTEGTRFHFVQEIDVDDTTWGDDVANDDAAANAMLESTEWDPPPEGLLGLVAMPNGFFVGFDGRDLYFSEPYRPHAWPNRYTLSVRYPIVGLGVYGAMLAVCTTSHPAIATGVNPEAITFIEIDAIEPCVSKRSIVAMDVGVLYCSSNGLTMVSASGVQNVTKDLIERDDWQVSYSPDTVRAVRYRDDYVGFYAGGEGFIINFDEAKQAITDIGDTRVFSNVGYDKYNGNILLLIDNNVWRWDPIGTLPYTYVWKSKLFRTAKPVNLGALQVELAGEPVDTTQLAEQIAEYNAARWADQPLDVFGWTGLGRRRPIPALAGLPLPQRSPIGGPMLYLAQEIEEAPAVTLVLYGNGKERWRRTVDSDGVHRLPSGYKTDTWQIEVIGNAEVVSIAVAETRKGLEKI